MDLVKFHGSRSLGFFERLCLSRSPDFYTKLSWGLDILP